jgi:methionyl-tRNA synthetase
MTKRFYVTTAIDYVNGEPHLGHAYEKIITDVIARAHHSLGEEVFFLTGLDEHGQKVKQAAQDHNLDPQSYCDQLAASWKTFASRLGLSINDFIRTSEPRHRQVVQAFLNRLHHAGHFYRAEYRGFYSTRQETFLTDKDRRPDGTFDPFYGDVIELIEENYYFRLREHQPWLIQHIESNPDFIQPDNRRNEVLGFLKNNPLEDLCSTRPASRLNWGIPIPFDTNYVTYVWFDALTNYISVPAALHDPVLLTALDQPLVDGAPQLWPADLHVVGKDIVKFHAVFWPIMLKSMGLPLPRTILAHGWWQKDGIRMSKTTGNVVDPIAVIDAWGLDAFRYYVVRELDIAADGNWTDAGFQARYTAELANGLGNLVNRSLSMLQRYRHGAVPPPAHDLADTVNQAALTSIDHLRHHRLQASLLATWSIVNRANQFVDQTVPFKLAKDPSQTDRLDAVLYNLAETCRILAVLLWPFIPDTAAKIHAQLGLSDPPDRFNAATWGLLPQGHVIGSPQVLFPRKDLAASNPKSKPS